jgi:hypothetical protein
MTAMPQFATFDALAERICGWEGRRSIEAPLGAMMRHGRHDEAEAALASYVALFPDAGLRQVVRSFTADRLVIGGWDRFHALARHTHAKVAAVALSGNVFDYRGPDIHLSDGERTHLQRVHLVCTYYDEPHPEADDPARLAAHIDEHGVNWLGEFDEIDTTLRLNGAEPLMVAINSTGSRGSDRSSQAMMFVCAWSLMFHLHRAVARDLAQLDFGASLPILVTAQDFSVEVASFYHASGATDPRDFEEARPKNADEIRHKIFQLEQELWAARKREKKRAKREERDYLDRDGEMSAAAENLRTMFKAYRKGDKKTAFAEGVSLVSNFRKLYRKFDY